MNEIRDPRLELEWRNATATQYEAKVGHFLLVVLFIKPGVYEWGIESFSTDGCLRSGISKSREDAAFDAETSHQALLREALAMYGKKK